MEKRSAYDGMVVVDLDGTLLTSDRKVSKRNRDTLEKLGTRKILRAAATGRSIHAVHKVLGSGFPFDFLVFSSGAGVLDWRTQELLLSYRMGASDVKYVSDYLIEKGFDFLVHYPIPENHLYYYYETGAENPDFAWRRSIHPDFGTPWEGKKVEKDATQLLIIEPGNGKASKYSMLVDDLGAFNVILATSPLDGKSRWIEIFPKSVCKSSGAQWLVEKEAIDSNRIIAVGNDYNDVDLLSWASKGFMVGNAPKELRNRFQTVPSNDEDGFSEAVQIALGFD